MNHKIEKCHITKNTQNTQEEINSFLSEFDIRSLSLGDTKELKAGFLNRHKTRERTRYSDIFADHSNIATYIQSIFKSFLRLPSDSDDLSDPSVGYQFPTSEFIENYRVQVKNDDPTPYINESPETVSNSLNDYILNEDCERYVSVVTGKVGSGKTTFLYYLKICHQHIFKSHKSIYCEIKYTANEIEKKNFLKPSEWEDYFENKFIGSAIYQIINSSYNGIKDDCKGFVEYFNASISMLVSDEDEINRLNRLVTSVVKNITGNTHIPLATVKKIDKRITHLLLEYLSEHGYSMLISIDGFDVFSMEEISESNQKGAFDVLAKIISGRFTLCSAGELPIRYLITLRTCTFEMFMDWYSENRHAVNVLRLAPVGINRILYSRVRKHLKEEGIEEDNLSLFIYNVIKVIKRKFQVEYDDNLVSVFNENYRRLIDYILDVIVYYSNKVVYEEGLCSIGEFLKSFGHASILEKYLRSQNLVEVLLMSSFSSYNNYYSFPDGDYTVKKKGSIDSGRGYIDNIFNYSLPSKGKIPYYLIKIRLVQIMAASKKHLNEQQIIDKMKALGYKMTHDEFIHYLKMLIAVGFARPRIDQSGGLSYNSTRKGEFITERLIGELRYTENTIQVSLFPKVLLNYLIGARKYATAENGDTRPIVHWIFASLINNYIHVQYIKYIEDAEVRLGADIHQTRIVGKDRGRWSLDVTVSELKNAMSHILENPISGTSEYLNARYLYNHIVQMKEDWKRVKIYYPHGGRR